MRTLRYHCLLGRYHCLYTINCLRYHCLHGILHSCIMLAQPNTRTRCYPYFPYSYPYFYTLISLSYPYFYGILCTWYMLVQPIFSCILLNMVGNFQYLVFTSNKMQNFNIFYTQLHTCLYLLYYRCFCSRWLQKYFLWVFFCPLTNWKYFLLVFFLSTD